MTGAPMPVSAVSPAGSLSGFSIRTFRQPPKR